VLKEPHEPRLPFGRTDAARLAVAAVLFVVAMAVGVVPDLSPSDPGLSVGALAPSTVRAPYDASIANPIETKAAQDAAAAAVAPRYDYTTERAAAIADQQVAVLTASLVPVDSAFSADKTPLQRQAELATVLPALDASDRQILTALEPDRWPEVKQAALSLLREVEKKEIKDRSKASDLVAASMPPGFSQSEQELISALVTPVVVANSAYSLALTEQARTAASDSVDTVYNDIREGEILVTQGQRITAADMVRITYFELDKATVPWGRALAWVTLGIMVAAMLLAWLWRFRPDYWHRGRTLVLIGLISVGAALAEKLVAGHAWLPYAIPTAAVAMILTVLLDAGAAMIVLAFLAVLAGIAGEQSLELSSYVFFGGLAGLLAIGKGERQQLFARAAVAVALASIAVVGVFALLGQHDTTGTLQLAAAAVLASIIATVVTLGSFTLLGNLFGILTGSQLLELANPSQPLLRRLLTEAPGTYHHSLMVGNLAERAAEAIGADPLLVRVAAYYHDVGKLGNPPVFIENQQGENVHDQLEPEDSAALLRQHIGDGVELAYRARLPKPLISFIPEHHGTGLISYFYAKAREAAAAANGGLDTAAGRAAADRVDMRLYRHNGPKPQSREAAVLMLADGVEASVRSLSSRDEATIRAMVDQIISERLTDGQFSECDLTMRDLEHIREAFVGQLLGMYHQRIEYPQNKVVEGATRRKRGKRRTEEASANGGAEN
jgi:putative nucleotidyltransferase with HDIG domain